MQVHVVERGLHLVHQVEGRRPGAEHREQVRQRGERTLTAGEQRQAAHVLARRTRLHLDPGVEQVVGVGEREPPRPAGEQRGEELREVAAHVVERGGEHGDDLLVDRPDHPVELAATRLDVVELFLEELVTFEQRVVLLQRERVDRTHDAQLAVEVACPPGQRGTGRHFGRGSVERDRGLAVEVGAQLLDRALEPQAASRLRRRRGVAGARAARRARARPRRATGAGVRADASPPRRARPRRDERRAHGRAGRRPARATRRAARRGARRRAPRDSRATR